MNSIVEQLISWTQKNSAMLGSHGVQITEKFPEVGSRHPWKASIELAYKYIVLSYTVWERTGFQTELLVMNTSTGKTIVMDERSPSDPSVVDGDMDEVAQNLIANVYAGMKPDPKLTIS